MRITKFGHSCLHVEDGDARILFDPGTFSAGFEQLTGLTAVLITHQHADHLDMARLPAVLAANPQATVYADAASAGTLRDAGVEVTAVSAGQTIDVGTPVTVHGRTHAVIHADIPVIPNAQYLVGGRLLHPGDSLEVPDVAIEVLALPASAPWMALKEAVEFYRTVAPTVAFPIHERILAHPAMVYGNLDRLKPAGSSWLEPADGEQFEI